MHKFENNPVPYIWQYGLRTLIEGINQRYLKNWADVAKKICFWPYQKIWDWDWIFGRAVKAISSLGVRSLWCRQQCRNQWARSPNGSSKFSIIRKKDTNNQMWLFIIRAQGYLLYDANRGLMPNYLNDLDFTATVVTSVAARKYVVLLLTMVDSHCNIFLQW